MVERRVGIGQYELRVADTVVGTEELLDLLEVAFGNDVRCKYEFEWFAVAVAEMLDVVLVGRPRAACNERWQGLVGTIEEELLNLGERLGLQGDVVHTIETGVAGDGASVVADAFEQFDGFLVLYEYVAVALQLLCKPFAVSLRIRHLVLR